MLKYIKFLLEKIVIGQYRAQFGIYWTWDFRKRCPNCWKPLKYGSQEDPSILYCCACNSKYTLRDQSGKKITEAEAINRMKKQAQEAK